MHHDKKGADAAKHTEPCSCPFCGDFDCPIPEDTCKSKPVGTLVCPECKQPLKKGSNVCHHCTTA